MKRFDSTQQKLLNEILGLKTAGNLVRQTAKTAGNLTGKAVQTAGQTAKNVKDFGSAVVAGAKNPLGGLINASDALKKRSEAKETRVGSENNLPQKNSYVYLQEDPNVTAQITEIFVNKKDFKVKLMKLTKIGNKITTSDSDYVFVQLADSNDPKKTENLKWSIQQTKNVNKNKGQVLSNDGKLIGDIAKRNNIFQISFDMNVSEKSSHPNWILYSQTNTSAYSQEDKVEGTGFTTKTEIKPLKPKQNEKITVNGQNFIYKNDNWRLESDLKKSLSEADLKIINKEWSKQNSAFQQQQQPANNNQQQPNQQPANNQQQQQPANNNQQQPNQQPANNQQQQQPSNNQQQQVTPNPITKKGGAVVKTQQNYYYQRYKDRNDGQFKWFKVNSKRTGNQYQRDLVTDTQKIKELDDAYANAQDKKNITDILQDSFNFSNYIKYKGLI
jgi:hypothetical protein